VRGNSSHYPSILLKATAVATDKKLQVAFEVLIAVFGAGIAQSV
jgi:hypothetical protein